MSQYTRWAWKAVPVTMRTRNGFEWPTHGPVLAAGPFSDSTGPCPENEGDGLCLAKTPAGATSGGYGLLSSVILLVSFEPDDVLGESEDKVRVRKCVTHGVLDARAACIRPGANLWGADLRGAYLQYANLWGANLRNADLRSANLRNADLRSADLRNADLWDADLRNADLTGADLRSANLQSDDLRGADLTGADLRNADLRSADLRNADLTGADLHNADLRNASGYGSVA